MLEDASPSNLKTNVKRESLSSGLLRKTWKGILTDVLHCWLTVFCNNRASRWWITRAIKLSPWFGARCRSQQMDFSFSPVIPRTPGACSVYGRSATSLLWEMRPHLHNTEHSMAKWSKLEPLASAEPYYWRPYITFYRSQAKHICFHLANFSLRDIWIGILYLHSFAPSPPLRLVIPACATYIKTPFSFFLDIKTLLFWCVPEWVWLQNTIGVSRKLSLP